MKLHVSPKIEKSASKNLVVHQNTDQDRSSQVLALTDPGNPTAELVIANFFGIADHLRNLFNKIGEFFVDCETNVNFSVRLK